jgi:hypothetical protein
MRRAGTRARPVMTAPISAGRPGRVATCSHHRVIKRFRGVNPRGRNAHHAFGSATALWSGLAHPCLQQAFLLQSVDRGVERSKGAVSASRRLDFLANRHSIGSLAQDSGRRNRASVGRRSGRLVLLQISDDLFANRRVAQAVVGLHVVVGNDRVGILDPAVEGRLVPGDPGLAETL